MNDELSLDVALQAAKVAVDAIWDKKGFEVVLLRVKEVVQYTDYIVIASASSDRHAMAIADNIEFFLHKELKQKPIGSEGRQTGRWVLLDYSDFVVHVFHRPVRDYYEIERLYADATRVELNEPAWVQETSPDALQENAIDYREMLWNAPADPNDADADDGDVIATWDDEDEEAAAKSAVTPLTES